MTPQRPFMSVAIALACAAAACTGDIGDGARGGNGPRAPEAPSPAGTAAAPAVNTVTTPGAVGAVDDGTPLPTGPVLGSPAPSSRFYRLSHKQWENAVRDLLRLPVASGLSATFTAEPGRSSFDNAGGLLSVSPTLWGDYQRAAEQLADRAAGDPAQLARILPAGLPAAAADRARAFVERFGLRAYRRPLGPAEIDEALGVWNKAAQGATDAFAAGVQGVLTLFLQSPFFLYRIEGATAASGGRVALDDYEVAAKLSFGLTGSIPDDDLLAAAAQHRLATAEGARAAAMRLLSGAAAEATTVDFHRQLLQTAAYDSISKDAKVFPQWKPAMAADMKGEVDRFVTDVLLTRGAGLAELLTAPYTIVSNQTAPLYGITPPAGSAPATFARQDLDPTRRAGIFTQLGFLSAVADAQQPNTILRGAFVNLQLLCVALPSPPPNVPPLPRTGGTTDRKRVEAHTGPGTCGEGCHSTLVNPPGYALESFDALGRWRSQDNGEPVDAGGTYVFDGEPRRFSGAVEFARLLAASKQAHECWTRNWLEYVLARPFDPDVDQPLVAQLGDRSRRLAQDVRTLLVELVGTDAFLTRTP